MVLPSQSTPTHPYPPPLPGSWYGLLDQYNSLVARQQDALDGTGKDPGLGALAAQFEASKKLTGQNKLGFLSVLNTNIQHEYAGSLADLSVWYDQDSNLSGPDKFVTGGRGGAGRPFLVAEFGGLHPQKRWLLLPCCCRWMAL